VASYETCRSTHACALAGVTVVNSDGMRASTDAVRRQRRVRMQGASGRAGAPGLGLARPFGSAELLVGIESGDDAPRSSGRTTIALLS